MNRVLARQLRRLGLSADAPPTDIETWAALLQRIDAFYGETDRARYLLERSIEVSSHEFQALNDEIRELSRRDLQRREEMSRHNFHELPVASWLEDFREVVSCLDRLRADGVLDLGAYFDTDPERLRALVGEVRVIDCNSAVCDLVGAAREDLLGPVDASTLGPEPLAAWRRQFEAIWDGVGRVEVEFTGQRSDGTTFPASLKWSVARFEGAFDYSRVMVVIIDISDRIASEERMRDLVKAKDEFLASVSHELRTPLTSVVGFAELLREVEDCDPEHRQMVEAIAQQAADLADIVEDLLVGARSDLGQLRVERKPFDAVEVAAAVATAFPRISLAAVGPLWAMGDPGRVRQVIRNLVSNAERYGGADIRMSVADTDAGIVISLSDDGVALAPDLVDRIFDRYFRRDRDRSRPASVGIGLTISRELARRMGGELVYRHDGARAYFDLVLVRAVPMLQQAV